MRTNTFLPANAYQVARNWEELVHAGDHTAVPALGGQRKDCTSDNTTATGVGQMAYKQFRHFHSFHLIINQQSNNNVLQKHKHYLIIQNATKIARIFSCLNAAHIKTWD